MQVREERNFEVRVWLAAAGGCHWPGVAAGHDVRVVIAASMGALAAAGKKPTGLVRAPGVLGVLVRTRKPMRLALVSHAGAVR